MCRSKSNSSAPRKDDEGAIFDELCTLSYTVTSKNGRKHIVLDHHIYNQLSDCWIRSASKPQPYVSLTVRCENEDYKSLGLELKPTVKPSVIRVIADTGCQSCLVGHSHLKRIGVTEDHLIPVSMNMRAANNNAINILGAAILRFSGKSPSGKTIETRQVVYVSNSTDRCFMSREGCIALGIISDSFPTIGENPATSSCPVMESQNPPDTVCKCPKRTLPPAKPTKLPFPAT